MKLEIGEHYVTQNGSIVRILSYEEVKSMNRRISSEETIAYVVEGGHGSSNNNWGSDVGGIYVVDSKNRYAGGGFPCLDIVCKYKVTPKKKNVKKLAAKFSLLDIYEI